jgi:hypothetical protein
MMYQPPEDEPRYLSLKGVMANYPFTEGQLRDFIFRKDKLGLDKVLRKIGRRWYFRADLLDDWIEQQNAKRNV